MILFIEKRFKNNLLGIKNKKVMYGWTIIMICCLVATIACLILGHKAEFYSDWKLCFDIFGFIAGVMVFVSGIAVVGQNFDSKRNILYLQEQQVIFQKAIEQSDGVIEAALLNKVVEANKEIIKMKTSKEVYGKFSYHYNVPDSLLVPIEINTEKVK